MAIKPGDLDRERGPKRGRRRRHVGFVRVSANNPDLVEMRTLARSMSVEALEGLAALARNRRVDPLVRLHAWREVLDRAYGKPPQALYVGGKGDAVRPYVVLLAPAKSAADDWAATVLPPPMRDVTPPGNGAGNGAGRNS